MTTLELFFITLAFLLVGGFEQITERCRALLDLLRPPRTPGDYREPQYYRRIHEPLKPGEVERELNSERPLPPVPPAGMFEDDPNPDHRQYEHDKDLGGVSTAIPPHMLPPENEE